uniref:Uncharacterized protein n=1 Tax=Arundo donax TaxID=35708 RepID=A0A0A9BGE6_ARUDO
MDISQKQETTIPEVCHFDFMVITVSA